MMTPLLKAVSKKMHAYLGDIADSQEIFETKNLCGRFSIDGLASCAFGVDAKAFDEGPTEFLHHSQNAFKVGKIAMFKLVFAEVLPNVLKKIAVSLGLQDMVSYAFANEHTKFLMNVVEQSFKQRKESNIK